MQLRIVYIYTANSKFYTDHAYDVASYPGSRRGRKKPGIHCLLMCLIIMHSSTCNSMGVNIVTQTLPPSFLSLGMRLAYDSDMPMCRITDNFFFNKP